MKSFRQFVAESIEDQEKKLKIIDEDGEELDEDNPCYKGYVMVGTKMKRGRKVPNCVPKK